MAFPAVVRKYRGVGLFVLLFGGFLAYQYLWTPMPVDKKATPREAKVVHASVDKQQTLHSQVNDLKEQLATLMTTMAGTTKSLTDIQRDRKEAEDALRREQKERAVEQANAKRVEERLRDELEAARRKKAQETAQTPPARGQRDAVAVPAVPTPIPLFELRTIGTSQGRPKHAPTSLMHHRDTAYLPAACFAKVRLVSGVNATSQLGGGGGATWGHPILYVIREPFECARQLNEIGAIVRASQLRPRSRVPLDGCLGLGTGKADLATSRVQVEGTLLSCVMPDGEAYEVPIKAFLLGADGTQGLVGDLQSHESAKVGKAFLVGIMEEAAAFINAARKGVTISVSGQTLPYGGVETTFQQLGKYFLEQARALQPTLFVPSATEGYLVMLQGVPLEGMHLVNWLTTGAL